MSLNALATLGWWGWVAGGVVGGVVGGGRGGWWVGFVGRWDRVGGDCNVQYNSKCFTNPIKTLNFILT